MNFKKIALITGARSGIGKAISTLFLNNKIIVIGTSRNADGASKISRYLKKNGKGYVLDITSVQDINKTLDKIFNEFGKIDILINNAGIINDNLLVRMKEEELEKVINTNLISIFMLSKIVLRSMIRRRYGRIVSIGSVVGEIGNIGQTNYAASKAGIVAFTKSLAREVASRGITVNVVSPGFVETNMTKNLDKEKRKKILSNIPIRRFGYAKEIASVVEFLISDGASYITGETIHVNGGMYMS